MESLTLQHVDEDDVALDMDGWDLDSEDSVMRARVRKKKDKIFVRTRMVFGWLETSFDSDREAFAHGPINDDEDKFSFFTKKVVYLNLLRIKK